MEPEPWDLRIINIEGHWTLLKGQHSILCPREGAKWQGKEKSVIPVKL